MVSVEKDPQHFSFINKIIKEVKTDKCFVLKGDVFKYIERCNEKFDFIFADPPYALERLSEIPDMIFKFDLLKEDGLFVLEHGKDLNLESHPNFIEHSYYGSVNFSFFRKDTKEEDRLTTAEEKTNE